MQGLTRLVSSGLSATFFLAHHALQGEVPDDERVRPGVRNYLLGQPMLIILKLVCLPTLYLFQLRIIPRPAAAEFLAVVPF